MNLSQYDWEEIPDNAKLSIKYHAEQSLFNFTKLFFQLIKRQVFIPNWHHKVVCDYLQDIIEDKADNNNLIINIPPGAGKTEITCIMAPAYCLALALSGKINRFRSFNISFNKDRVEESSGETQSIVFSEPFVELWGGEKDVSQVKRWTVKKDEFKVGSVHCASAGGKITGGRGGYVEEGFSGWLNLDDIQKPLDALSETKRASTQTLLTGTILSRRALEGTNGTAIINIQQRLHEDDATAFMMSGGMGGLEFDKIIIPGLLTEEFLKELKPKHQEILQKYLDETPYVIHNNQKHWSYWEFKKNADSLLKLKKYSPEVFYTQYQQDPRLASDKIFDISQFATYAQLPRLEQRFVVIDTNSGKEGEYYDKTVFLHAGLGVDKKIYIINVLRGTYSPDLLKHITWMILTGELPDEQGIKELVDANVDYEYWSQIKYTDKICPQRLTDILIEEKQAGQGLITDIKKKYGRLKQTEKKIKLVEQGNRNISKLVRNQDCSPHVRAGEVVFPAVYDKDGKEIYKTYYYHPREQVKWLAGKLSFMPALMKELEELDVEVLTNRSAATKDKKKFDDQYDTIMYAVEYYLHEKDKKMSMSDVMGYFR